MCFGRPVPVISMFTNTVLDYIFTTDSQRILQWNLPILQLAQFQIYADAVSVKQAALNYCFGFISVIVQPIFRPGEHQSLVYNGHKRVHALKFQSIAFPSGLVASMYGPVGEDICNSSILFLKRRTPSLHKKNAVHIWDNW